MIEDNDSFNLRAESVALNTENKSQQVWQTLVYEEMSKICLWNMQAPSDNISLTVDETAGMLMEFSIENGLYRK